MQVEGSPHLAGAGTSFETASPTTRLEELLHGLGRFGMDTKLFCVCWARLFNQSSLQRPLCFFCLVLCFAPLPFSFVSFDLLLISTLSRPRQSCGAACVSSAQNGLFHSRTSPAAMRHLCVSAQNLAASPSSSRRTSPASTFDLRRRPSAHVTNRLCLVAMATPSLDQNR